MTDDELESALATAPADRRTRPPAVTTRSTRRGSRRASTRPTRDVAARLAAGNRAYEERFDRVFLIRAAGRSGPEILAELDRRLGNDAATERAETVDPAARDRAAPAGAGALTWPPSARTSSTPAPGRPAAGVHGGARVGASGEVLGDARTDADGRVGSIGERPRARRLPAPLRHRRVVLRRRRRGVLPGGGGRRSRSPPTSTSTCRCCSAATATRPTVAPELDVLIRARRAVVDGRETPVAVGIRAGRIAALAAYDDPADARGRRRAPRRRGPAPRAGRHPRARQRAGPHRVGGLRDRDPRGGRGRGHDHRRHAAQQHPADHHGGRARGEAGGGRGTRRGSTSGFWGGAVPGNLADLSRAARGRASSASSASCSTPVSRSSRTSRPTSSPTPWRRPRGSGR